VAFRTIHPGMVFKMGLSQSAAQLPNDARWCFSSSNPSTRRTKVVILLHVSWDPWRVSFILVLSCAEVSWCVCQKEKPISGYVRPLT
jgi:hypothetical protein